MSFQQAMIDAFIERIEKNFKDIVKCVIVYGSFVTGEMHDKSDLDLVVIGQTDRLWDLSTQFIYQDIGYDFFCMTEERLNAIIREFQPLVSIVAEGRLVYAKDEETKAWFNSQKQHLINHSQFTSYSHYHDKIGNVIQTMKALAFDHLWANPTQKILIQGQLLYQFAHFLGLLNRKHLRHGIKHFMDELSSFSLKPKTTLYYLSLLTHENVSSNDIMTFVYDLNQYWIALNKSNQDSLTQQDFSGFYEEALSGFQKLYHACETNNLDAAFLTATTLESELQNYRDKGAQIDSMFAHYDGSVQTLSLDSHHAQNGFLSLIKQYEVHLLRFETEEEVLNHLKRL